MRIFFFISNPVAKASALKLAKKLSNLLSNPHPRQLVTFFRCTKLQIYIRKITLEMFYVMVPFITLDFL